MKQSFYRAFEDKYRGSRELIRARLEHYAPFVRPLLPPPGAPGAPVAAPAALDLGCGRGEWMELLREWGFETHGVDLDAGMLQACRDIGLKVVEGDALAYLRSLPDASQAVVSAFHVVEHIGFNDLETLVTEAMRVLVPAGLLILETPNPENLIVGTERFYLDPTHTQPIPHLLLSFLLEHHGFGRVKVLPLQELDGIRDKQAVGIYDVIAGVSPDYAAIGQKTAPAPLLAPFDSAFAASYGQDLLGLALRFDDLQARRAAAQQAQLASVQDGLVRLGEIRDLLEQQLRMAQQDAAQHADEARRLREEVRALHASTSWRITAPVRLLSRTLQRLRGGPAAESAAGAAANAADESTSVPLSAGAKDVYDNLKQAKALRKEAP
ncbi:MAG: class I SAM-dependent methyltransferase [Pseudomonadota bacterium]